VTLVTVTVTVPVPTGGQSPGCSSVQVNTVTVNDVLTRSGTDLDSDHESVTPATPGGYVTGRGRRHGGCCCGASALLAARPGGSPGRRVTVVAVPAPEATVWSRSLPLRKK
jgi:hypothetical protein